MKGSFCIFDLSLNGKVWNNINPNFAKPRDVSSNPMTELYYKRHFNENRIEKSETWGTCIYYFESNHKGEILRQIEIYENGKRLKYSEEFIEDEFGFLADQTIKLLEFEEYAINKNDFEYQWTIE